MPTARRSRVIGAPASEVWEIVRDPHHLPRWWPRVERTEDVVDGAFTEVMRTAKGKVVRADFDVLSTDEQGRAVSWSQRVEGTPFGRLLSSAVTEVRLREPEPGAEATEVTLELRQSLNGVFPRLGGRMVRRAAGATLEEALDGLERISS